jgi:hypothetical protein
MEKMFESMNITEDQKVALQEEFDKAVLKKTTEMIDEHVESLVEEKVEVLEEEYKEKVTLLEDSLDGYLDTVVEEFIEENAPMYEAQISDEKAQTLLEMFDQMVKVVGVDMLTISESKVDRDAEEYENTAVARVDVLESKIADMADRLVESNREAEKYLQAGIIAETKEGLSLLESDKFEKLAEMVPFEKSGSYLEKLETIKETIIASRGEDFEMNTKLPAGTLPKAAFRQPDVVDADAAQDFSKYI